MTDELFFTLDDVRLVRAVSVNINDFDMYAQEVQRNYVQRILGDDLYTEMLNDLVGGVPQTARFIELINGVVYSYNGRRYRYRGLKQYASYLWMYNYLLDGQLQVTPIGAQIFKDEEATNAQNHQSNRQLRDHCIRVADSMEESIIDFIQKDDTYPEYSLGNKEEPASEDNFVFEKIGRSYYTPTNKFD